MNGWMMWRVVPRKGCQLNKACYISSESGQGGDYNAPILREKGPAVLEIWYEWSDGVAAWGGVNDGMSAKQDMLYII